MTAGEKQEQRLAERSAILRWLRRNTDMPIDGIIHHINRGAHRSPGDLDEV